MKRWFGSKKLSNAEFESHQDKLLRLSKDVLRQHAVNLEAELSNPERIAAIYGSGFADAPFKEQAEKVALTASNILQVPNADVSYVLPDRHEAVASVRDFRVIPDPKAFNIAESYCKNVISTGRELAIEISANHPLVCDTSFSVDGVIVSYLGVPVAAEPGGTIVGVLCVWSGQERVWTVSDVHMLTQLSLTLTRFLKAVA